VSSATGIRLFPLVFHNEGTKRTRESKKIRRDEMENSSLCRLHPSW
jgi:hypothetical protein